MASLPIDHDEAPPPPRKHHLLDLMQADNIADMLDDGMLNRIGGEVIRDLQLDEASRKTEGWDETYQKSLDIAMQVKEAKTSPWPGAANVKYPLLTTASIQFQARAYPVIVDGSSLVKCRVLGPDDEQGTKRSRADRIAAHMSWQLLYKMPGWEEDTDRLLLMLPIVGSVIRKSYYDKIGKTNRSDMVTADDFVIDYWAKSLDEAPRFTHRIKLYPYEVRERVTAGLWLDVRTEQEGKNATDNDGLVEFYEQHRMIDLDDDGYPEPYVVTTNKDGQIARIVACYGPEDVTVKTVATPDAPADVIKLDELDKQGMAHLADEVVRIERRKYFTHYAFLPSPDGGFYGMGFGQLLAGIGAVIDDSANAMMDSATLQNAGGGFIGSPITAKSGKTTVDIGKWLRVDTGGGILRDNIVPFSHQGPSAVMFNLLQMLIEAAKDMTSSSDALTGGSAGTEQPTTLLARIEQAQKVMTGIFKRIHRAFGQELRILRRLNGEYLDQQEYFALNDEPSAIEKADYQDADLDVVPVSDPTQVSDLTRMARSEAEWQSFNGDPLINQVELRRRRMEALGVRDPKALLAGDPPPDPKVLIEGAKLALEKMKVDAAYDQGKATAAKLFVDASVALVTEGLIEDAAIMAGAAIKLAQESSQYTLEAPDGQPADGPAGDAAMAGPSGDGGLPGVPPPAPDQSGGGMAAGPVGMPGPEGPMGSDVAGPAGGPVG